MDVVGRAWYSRSWRDFFFLIFRDLQALSLLIACFCHDLDHRGTNNSFQMEIKSPLAKLYSSEGSVNERHHLSQAICILNDENCKILDCLSTEQFKACIDDLRELILATDLANHFRYNLSWKFIKYFHSDRSMPWTFFKQHLTFE